MRNQPILTFTSIEAAVAALCKQTFGASLVLEDTTAPPAPPTHEQAAGLIADKDATIRRLKEKLTVAAKVMQDNIDLKAEVQRLVEQRDTLKAELNEVREAWQKDHMEMKRRLDAAAAEYRLLEVGEIMREDDEVYVGLQGWVPYGAAGGRINPKGLNPVGYYRRRIA